MINHIFILLEEIKRTFIYTKRYWLDFSAGFGMMYILFLGLYYGISKAEILPTRSVVDFLLTGYLVWCIFGMNAIVQISSEIMTESSEGTLEQLYMSPLGIVKILFCRMIGGIVRGIVVFIIMVLGIFIATGKFLTFIQVWLIIPLLLTLIGLYGAGFILAGLSLIFKRIQTLLGVLLWGLFFCSGAVFPLKLIPPIIQIFGYLLPLTQGLKVLRMMVIDQKSLIYVFQTGDLGLLILNSSIYFTCGLLIFKLADKFARNQGIIGHY